MPGGNRAAFRCADVPAFLHYDEGALRNLCRGPAKLNEISRLGARFGEGIVRKRNHVVLLANNQQRRRPEEPVLVSNRLLVD